MLQPRKLHSLSVGVFRGYRITEMVLCNLSHFCRRRQPTTAKTAQLGMKNHIMAHYFRDEGGAHQSAQDEI